MGNYASSFSAKTYEQENNDADVLMDAFGITPKLKRENRQYWGRELGMCWQRLVTELFRLTCPDYSPAYRNDADELCDLICGRDAIDTKYRIGSGDSGTLKKFRQYGRALVRAGYRPVLVIVRDDNLPAAITACVSGGWTVLTGQSAFDYIQRQTQVNLHGWLVGCETRHHIKRVL